MKLIKKYLIVLLSILTVTGACSCFSAAAESNDIIVGDVDGDGLINVLDATLIQKYIADLIGKDQLNSISADVNCNGRITIDDVTKIQSYAAGLSDSLYAGMTYEEAIILVKKKKLETPIIF